MTSVHSADSIPFATASPDTSALAAPPVHTNTDAADVPSGGVGSGPAPFVIPLPPDDGGRRLSALDIGLISASVVVVVLGFAACFALHFARKRKRNLDAEFAARRKQLDDGHSVDGFTIDKQFGGVYVPTRGAGDVGGSFSTGGWSKTETVDALIPPQMHQQQGWPFLGEMEEARSVSEEDDDSRILHPCWTHKSYEYTGCGEEGQGNEEEEGYIVAHRAEGRGEAGVERVVVEDDGEGVVRFQSVKAVVTVV
ncbi:hypothetical protein HDU98_009570 [Podochytrium sp. JEL0797]|nr:hypothetical protein HDU98_009570 [Podochytrium sp. JEL0797]